MDLLFQRAQHERPVFRKTAFKLHAKVEFSEEERTLMRKYGISNSILIDIDQPGLFRNALIITFICFAILTPVIAWNFFREIGLGWTGVYLISALISICVGFYFYHQKRETILLYDLIYGRYFRCTSVIELAKKEARLEGAVAFLRQVMETAKHWDGVEKRAILPLPADQAKLVILKSL